MVFDGLLKATDDVIRVDKSLKIPAGVAEPELDIKDINNSCPFSEGSENHNVQTGVSSDTYWR